MEMSTEDTEVFIKQEIDEDCNEFDEIKIEDIEQLVKVEFHENVAFDEELWNESQELEVNESDDDANTDPLHKDGLTEKEVNHIEWLKMKTQSLDSMKGKYNSQLQEYLRLAEILKQNRLTNEAEEILFQDDDEEEVEEKSIIPSRKVRQAKRKIEQSKKKEQEETFREKIEQSKKKEQEESFREIISKRMRKLEMESLSLDKPKSDEVTETNNSVGPKHSKHQKVVRKRQKMRKVELERERRKGLSTLFEELDSWVAGGKKIVNYENPRLNKIAHGNSKLPYHERICGAIGCIKKLETSINAKEVVLVELQSKNALLRQKLDHLKLKSFENFEDEEKSLIIDDNNMEIVIQNPISVAQRHKQVTPHHFCDKCQMSFNTVQEAFIHINDIVKHPPSGSVSAMPSKDRRDDWTVYKCKDCPTLCLDNLALRIHKFLHQELTYFVCPDCSYVFGLPSKLKRHFFLSHEKILDSELDHMLDLESRVDITLNIQDYLSSSHPAKVEVVDNFLEASLDAKLISDEISMKQQVEKIPVEVLNHLLKQYTEVFKG